MKNLIEKCRETLFPILLVLTGVSFICAVGSEAMSIRWIAGAIAIHLTLLALCIFVYDPRIFYRRLVPLGVCTASVIYVIFRPIFKHNRTFRKCYKIRKMSGSFSRCYSNVQEVYDEYSNNNTAEDATC